MPIGGGSALTGGGPVEAIYLIEFINRGRLQEVRRFDF